MQEPAATPVTTPPEVTVAIAVLSLLHASVPPLKTADTAVNDVVLPIQTDEAPDTEPMLALGLIVIAWNAETVPPHPPVTVYVILLDPAATPVTTPPEVTVATPVLLLLHAPVPPLVTTEPAVYVVVLPIHIEAVPVTEPTLALGIIVIACNADFVPPQPPVIVYTMLQLPAPTPVTTPPEVTVAIPVLLLLHAPVPPLVTTEPAV